MAFERTPDASPHGTVERFDGVGRSSSAASPTTVGRGAVRKPSARQGKALEEAELARKRTLTLLPQGITTLVVRNVPWHYMQDDLMKVWSAEENGYDFLHLPQIPNRGRTTTYAFINFTTHEGAVSFNEKWHGRFMPQSKAPKTLSIAVAKSQGLRSNLARFHSQQWDDMAHHGIMPITVRNNVLVDPRVLYLQFGLKEEEEEEEDAQAEVDVQLPVKVNANFMLDAKAPPQCFEKEAPPPGLYPVDIAWLEGWPPSMQECRASAPSSKEVPCPRLSFHVDVSA